MRQEQHNTVVIHQTKTYKNLLEKELGARSSALPWLLSLFFPTFLAAFPEEEKELHDPSAAIVWSDTIGDLILLHVTHIPRTSFTGMSVFLFWLISPLMFVEFLPPTQ